MLQAKMSRSKNPDSTALIVTRVLLVLLVLSAWLFTIVICGFEQKFLAYSPGVAVGVLSSPVIFFLRKKGLIILYLLINVCSLLVPTREILTKVRNYQSSGDGAYLFDSFLFVYIVFVVLFIYFAIRLIRGR